MAVHAPGDPVRRALFVAGDQDRTSYYLRGGFKRDVAISLAGETRVAPSSPHV